MNNISISIASESDLSEILDLQKRAYVSEAAIYNDFNIPPLKQTVKEIEEEYENHTFLKAEYKGKIIGSVRAREEQSICFIGKLIVDSAVQNQGLGKKLLAAIESEFPNVIKYELFTGHKSQKNLYLYKKQGYSITDKEKINDSLTMVTLEKDNK